MNARAVTFAFGVAIAITSPASAQDSDGASVSRAELDTSNTMVYRTSLERGDRRLVGGIVYALLPVSAARAYALLRERERFVSFFPKLRSTRLVGEMPPDLFVEFEHGGATFHTRHTLRIRFTDADRSVKFWLEPRFPHDVRDAWGYLNFSEDPSDPKKSVLTYGVLVDMGLGLFDMVIEDRVRALLLSVPERIQHELTQKH